MRTLASIALILALAACSSGGGPTPPSDTPIADVVTADVSPTDTPASDAVVTDTSPRDVFATDAPAPDALAVDAPLPDVLALDTSAPDVPAMDTSAPDARPGDVPPLDAPPDVPLDVRPDVALDGPLDAPADVAPDVAPDVACVAGQTRCGAACVDTGTNGDHCGGCGRVCCAGLRCVSGRCAAVCSTGNTQCYGPGDICGACFNLATDTNNCGMCGRACPAGTPCVAGSCLPCGGCTTGSTCCGGRCLNLQTDAANCGACGVVCPSGAPCVAGACVTCASPRITCGGACVDPRTTPSHCGGCGQACCAGNVCQAGTCDPVCPPGLSACPLSMSTCRGGSCANLQTDAAHCGACGTRCATGETCVSGVCRGGGFMSLAPCLAASDYTTTGSTIRFGDSVGFAYSPRCLTVRVNATVTWEGTFSGHPLEASTRGSAGPITRVSTGSSASFRFARAGFYPYYCAFHGSDSGGGMSGVVQVIE